MKKIRSYTRDRRALEDQITRRAQEVEALNEIAAVTSQSSDLGEIINLALQRALRLIGVNQGGIYLLEERSGLLRYCSPIWPHAIIY